MLSISSFLGTRVHRLALVMLLLLYLHISHVQQFIIHFWHPAYQGMWKTVQWIALRNVCNHPDDETSRTSRQIPEISVRPTVSTVVATIHFYCLAMPWVQTKMKIQEQIRSTNKSVSLVTKNPIQIAALFLFKVPQAMEARTLAIVQFLLAFIVIIKAIQISLKLWYLSTLITTVGLDIYRWWWHSI